MSLLDVRDIVANDNYCLRILHFKTNASSDMKYHIKKTGSFYVNAGQFEYHWIDTKTADIRTKALKAGDCVSYDIAQPHRLVCIQEGDVFEISTKQFEDDTHYVTKHTSNMNKKHQQVALLMHMGLGDHIVMAPAVFEVAKQTEKLYIPCKSMYLEALKSIYADVTNLELLPIQSTTDERVLGSEIQRVLGELQKKGEPLAVAATGMYNAKPTPLYSFPASFYKDIGLDFMTCRKGFKWNVKQSPLLAIFQELDIKHVFVHDVSSTQKGDRITSDVFTDAAADKSTIVLNPDRNMYTHSHPFYYLAQLAVRKSSQSILDYVSIMESAHGLYLIDSCYFCMSSFINLSAVRVKNVYKRSALKFEWMTPELGWNEISL
jgi:hypothetical protein